MMLSRLPILCAIAGLALWSVSLAQPSGPAVVLTIDGPIGPATAQYVEQGLDAARERNAVALVLRMDTPGGLDASMRDIIRDILAAPIPVVSFVAPQGARAASAGTYMLYASHVAAMAPGTNLGAATPIQIGGGSQPLPGGKPDEEAERDGGAPDTGRAKLINDAAAYIRGLAELRGRNAEWAEKAVREAASLTSSEALDKNVIDVIAGDVASLLARIDGRIVKLGQAEHTLRTAGAEIVEMEPGWRLELLSILTNPNVAFILMLVGIYGIIFELSSPGAIFPGVIGAIALVSALYALNVLPVNWAGLALVLLGVAFMAAEAFVPSFGVLGIGGLVAFAFGAAILFDTDAPGFTLSWPMVAGTTAGMGVLMVLLVGYLVRAHRHPIAVGAEHMIGEEGKVESWSGDSGYVRLGGELWRATAPEELPPGGKVRVAGLSGLILKVEPEPGERKEG